MGECRAALLQLQAHAGTSPARCYKDDHLIEEPLTVEEEGHQEEGQPARVGGGGGGGQQHAAHKHDQHRQPAAPLAANCVPGEQGST